jgi:hypothetical protein
MLLEKIMNYPHSFYSNLISKTFNSLPDCYEVIEYLVLLNLLQSYITLEQTILTRTTH